MNEIVRAGPDHLDETARLFDLYRQFYDCEPDLPLARDYIADRMAADDSIIWIALDGDQGRGFVQCYPTFCSVQAIRRWVLYDLYVQADVRGRGLGERLMNAARDGARADGAERIDLETAHDNLVGQALYEKLGYRRDEHFFSYSLGL